MPLDRIMQAVSGTPWFIEPEKAREILGVLELRLEQGSAPPRQSQSDQPDSERPNVVDGVALISVRGTISPRMNMISAMSGGTSTELIGRQLRIALKDPEVKAIMLDMDSPGGNAVGIVELADEIFANRSQKPIVGMVNHLSASAAYYIGAACGRVVISPSGSVGSIGAVAVHTETSERDKEMGVKHTIICSPKGKSEGNSMEPLTSEAQAHMQEWISEIHLEFATNVAKYRGVSLETVLAKYGKGKTVRAKTALKAGMVDAVATFEQELARLQAHVPARTSVTMEHGAVTGRCDVELVEVLKSIGLADATTVEEAEKIVADLAVKASLKDETQEALDMATDALNLRDERIVALQTENTVLKADVIARDIALRNFEVEAVLASAKLKPQAEAFARGLAENDMAKFKEFVAMQSSLAVERPSGRLQVTPVIEPIDSQAALHARICAVQSEKNVPYSVAYEIVAGQDRLKA